MMGEGEAIEFTVFHFQGKMCYPIKRNEHESVSIKGCDWFPGWLVAISLFPSNHTSCHNSESECQLMSAHRKNK